MPVQNFRFLFLAFSLISMRGLASNLHYRAIFLVKATVPSPFHETLQKRCVLLTYSCRNSFCHRIPSVCLQPRLHVGASPLTNVTDLSKVNSPSLFSHVLISLARAASLVVPSLKRIEIAIVGFAYAFQCCTAGIMLFQRGTMKWSVDEKQPNYISKNPIIT